MTDVVEEELEGLVQNMDPAKGTGWIRVKSTYYFFHKSGCRCRFDHLKVGDRVTFTATDIGKGPRAEDVDYA